MAKKKEPSLKPSAKEQEAASPNKTSLPPQPPAHELWGHAVVIDTRGALLSCPVGIDRATRPGEQTPAAAPPARIATLRDAVQHGTFPAATSTLLARDVLRVVRNGLTTVTNPTAELCEALQQLRVFCAKWLGRAPGPDAVYAMAHEIMETKGTADVDELYNRPWVEFAALAEEACKLARKPPPLRRCRLTISGDRILLDGEDEPLDGTPEHRENVVAYLRHLIEAGGDRKSDPEVSRYITVGRLDRLRKKLPTSLRALIDTNTKGSKLVPEAWHR
jgi:hypothetical protein